MPGPGPYGNKRKDAIKWRVAKLYPKRPMLKPKRQKKLKWKG